jgi:crossover junction endodeoxyribonuclease RuvC
MRVLGIDPGSRTTGWGVVEHQRGRYVHVASGAIRTDAKAPMVERLAAIHAGLQAVIRQYAPESVAIEAVFKHKSAASALVLGQARGVALLAAGQCGHDPAEYNASTVKRTVGAWGHADKDAVARMVRLLLGADVVGPADVTDALAIAITHCAHARAPKPREAR